MLSAATTAGGGGSSICVNTDASTALAGKMERYISKTTRLPRSSSAAPGSAAPGALCATSCAIWQCQKLAGPARGSHTSSIILNRSAMAAYGARKRRAPATSSLRGCLPLFTQLRNCGDAVTTVHGTVKVAMDLMSRLEAPAFWNARIVRGGPGRERARESSRAQSSRAK